MSVPEPRPESRPVTALTTAAFVLASSVVGAPLLVLLLVEAVLYQLNPRGLDLTDAGAYEAEILGAGAVAGLVIVIAILRVFSVLASTAGRAALRYPALIIQLQVGTAIGAIALILLTPGLAQGLAPGVAPL